MPSQGPSDTALLDAFNRADGALGSNWASPQITGFSAFTISSNVIGGSGFNSSGWTSVFGANQEVFATISVMPTAAYFRLLGRVTNPNSGNENAFCLFVGNDGIAYFEKYVAGVNSTISIIASGSPVFQVDDAAALVMRDTTLEAWRYRSGAWALIDSITDTSVSGGGAIGLMTGAESVARFDDFGGGSIRLSTLDYVQLPEDGVGQRLRFLEVEEFDTGLSDWDTLDQEVVTAVADDGSGLTRSKRLVVMDADILRELDTTIEGIAHLLNTTAMVMRPRRKSGTAEWIETVLRDKL